MDATIPGIRFKRKFKSKGVAHTYNTSIQAAKKRRSLSVQGNQDCSISSKPDRAVGRPYFKREKFKVVFQETHILKFFLFKYFLLCIFLNYISNAIPKVPHIHPPTLPCPPTPPFWPWLSPVLGHIKFVLLVSS